MLSSTVFAKPHTRPLPSLPRYILSALPRAFYCALPKKGVFRNSPAINPLRTLSLFQKQERAAPFSNQ